MSDDSFEDVDSSYNEFPDKKAVIDDSSIIDESSDEAEQDVDSDSASASSGGEEDISTVIPIKKKPVRRLASNSDSDSEENTPVLPQSDQGSLNGAKKGDRLIFSDESDSEEDNTADLSQSVRESLNGSKKDDQQQSISRESSKKSQSRRKDISEVIDTYYEDEDTTRNNASTAIIESDSSSESDDGGMVIDAFAESSKQIQTAAPTTHKSDVGLNTSADAKSRISQQFQFNSAGILNSTSIHEQAKEKWRPSILPEVTEDSSVAVISDSSSDIIEVSSNEASPQKSPFKFSKMRQVVKQQTLHSFVKIEPKTPKSKQTPTINVSEDVKEPTTVNISEDAETSKNLVSKAEYEAMRSKVDNLEMDFVKLQNMAENLDFETLPDKGLMIKNRLRIAKNKFMEERLKFSNMVMSEEIRDEQKQQATGAFSNVAWEDIQAGANAVLPKTFGKQAMSTYNAQKAVTLDRLQQLHGALLSCPKEDDLEKDPKGIKVSLMPHQNRALAWLMFREKGNPAGGILADDMGLGKTLTIISLILKCKEVEKADNDSDEENKNRNQYMGKHTKFDGGSLIVCPASLINQWSGEIDKRLKRGLLSYYLYHGPKRESKPKMLAEYDVVITTYAIVNNEHNDKSTLFRVKWRRIVLDEAHQIRNHKAQTSEACCQLSGRARWALTGTPMHNKELDMYALLKFLRCTPFDDLQVWKRWVCDKSRGGQERLHTVISSLMLRRTKAELMEKGALTCMPEKKWLLVKVDLDKDEMQVYHKVLIFSQTLFAQFLHQRAEKNQDYTNAKFTDLPNDAPNEEYFKMRKKLLRLNKVKNVSQHEILVLLLRLRQICCHPSLITAMLDGDIDDVGGDEECEELNILEQLQNLNIEDKDEDEFKPDETANNGAPMGEENVKLSEAAKGHLRPSDPVFATERASSKIKHMMKVLKKQVLPKDDKAIIVSQWSSYLNLIATHLKENDIIFDQLDGKVPVNKRMEMVTRFNDPKDSTRVLLLSLTAGGVGLNLVGANHLFLLDLHWNPQLENQAQDRIYRVGQTKPVFVYKFMAVDTIEERIKMLQDKKLAMAESILTGTRQVGTSKLSMEDLKMLLQM